MKKSIGRLAAEARNVFTKSMGRLRRKASKRQPSESIEAWKQKCYDLTRENERLSLEAQALRAQMCQLRVDAGCIHGRIGYMVGTYIPETVVKKLAEHPERASEFKRTVIDAMMESVLRGMLYRKENGKCVAMVFLPYGEKFTKRTVLPVFECDGKHEMIIPEKLRTEIDRALEQQRRDERKLLGY